MNLAADEKIELRGCRVHNLKSINVDLPRNQLIAVCGVSGAGKTSLVIDTLYAEGQRRYIESFSTYTRQFLERFDKPDYDAMDGLPPALALRRGGGASGNRSTVGTSSEALEYLRLLYAKVARPFCDACGIEVRRDSPQSAIDLLASFPGRRAMVVAAVAWEDAASRATVLADLQADGLVRLIAGERTISLTDADRSELADLLPRRGSVWVVVDRVKGGDSARGTESLEMAFQLGDGTAALFVEHTEAPESDDGTSNEAAVAAAIEQVDGRSWQVIRLSEALSCQQCSREFPEASPALFNFNNPLGTCPGCEGFGDEIFEDLDLIIPDRRKSLSEGAIAPWSTPAYSGLLDELTDIADEVGVPLDVPVNKLTKKQLSVVVDGHAETGFPGLKGFFEWLDRKKYKMHVRVFLSRWRGYRTCSSCDGQRLGEGALAYKIQGKSIAELSAMETTELRNFLDGLELEPHLERIAKLPLAGTLARLEYLENVGLGYLSLDRPLRTLSGGETQRTALAAVLGSSLVNMLYVLDEPSVGLHPDDTARLADAIVALARRGNTVVMIEHNETLIRRSDWLTELGPGAGTDGGQVCYAGPLAKAKKGESLTADFVVGRRSVTQRRVRREPRKWIQLRECTGNNLKHVTARIPAGCLVSVTGVSGSGKSSLVHETLYHAVRQSLDGSSAKGLPYKSLALGRTVDQCVLVTQAAVSKSSRSNAATVVKAMDEIRKVFADSASARLLNLTPGHFSFNSPKGRCDNCGGDGTLDIDMHFLADVKMTCPECQGTRYKPEVLQATYRDRTIADVLAMTASDGLDFFRGQPAVKQRLQILVDAGLGYLPLGQSTSTLSDGENQRLKLAAHLVAQGKKRCLFLLDEPSTGLHPGDLVKLLSCLNQLVENGHSVVMVEHNMHLVAASDYVIDLGPGAAQYGGEIVAEGTPEQVAATPESKTGQHLATLLN